MYTQDSEITGEGGIKSAKNRERRTVLCFVFVFLIKNLGSFTTKEGFPGGSDGREAICNAGDLASIPGSGDPLEEGMATHSNILAWRIPWIEETGGL